MEISNELLLTLKNEYGLKENHIHILKALAVNDLNADELCSKTKIPKGRIYEFLNYLIQTQLINKETGAPAQYSSKNLNDRVVEFAENHLNQELQKRAKLISLVDKDRTQSEFKVFTTPGESRMESRKAWTESKELKIILHGPYLPHILRTSEEIVYDKIINTYTKHKVFMRSLDKIEKDIKRKIYIKSINDGKIKCIYLLDEESVNELFSAFRKELTKNEFKELIKNMEYQLTKNKNLKIRIIKKPSEYNIRIFDNKKVHIMLRNYVYLTIATENKDVVDSYLKVFDKIYAQSRPFSEFLKEF